MKNHEKRRKHLKQLGFVPTGVLDLSAHKGGWMLATMQLCTDAYYLLLKADSEIVLLGDETTERATFFRGTSEYTSGNSIYGE